jgi:hypothetical protein
MPDTPGFIRRAADAIPVVYPGSHARLRRRRSRCVDVIAPGKHWPALLPQHGPGKKHARKIELLIWQRVITHRHPEALVRGLLHSDGCRCLASVRRRGRRYRYPRYYFANRSEDILRLFCDYLDVMGVAWTRSYDDRVQIARREAVAILDRFVGPKR